MSRLVRSFPCAILSSRVSTRTHVCTPLLLQSPSLHIQSSLSRQCTGVVKASATSQQPVPEEPWYLGFQCNERYLQWDQAAQLQLLRLVLAEKLAIEDDEVVSRLRELAILLPDFLTRMNNTRVDILLPILSDLPAFSRRLIALKDAFKGINFSELACKYPPILVEFSVEEIEKQLADMRAKLPGVRVELLVAEEPALMKADMTKVLADIRRLMGDSHDPVALLVAQPRMVLSMNDAGLKSALDVEGY